MVFKRRLAIQAPTPLRSWRSALLLCDLLSSHLFFCPPLHFLFFILRQYLYFQFTHLNASSVRYSIGLQLPPSSIYSPSSLYLHSFSSSCLSLAFPARNPYKDRQPNFQHLAQLYPDTFGKQSVFLLFSSPMTSVPSLTLSRLTLLSLLPLTVS